MENLLNLFRWQDALDIFILSFVFYRLYRWLRRKRTLRMVVAILALPFFYLIAQWIDLPLSVWGLQNLWAVILIVLVVIFQQEIREVLGSITLPALLSGRTPGEQVGSKGLERISGAAFKMAAKRIGGLIVLQREDDLDELIHGETLLDAVVNEDMLVSIFSPLSPLHDGAVIIRGNRIRSATALLPVSQAPSFPKEWGTRHRAGVGITEVSDAECIIISEERGEVLLASGGKVGKQRAEKDLTERLAHLSSASEEEVSGRAWLKRIFDDLPRKALCLALVCILWVFVVGVRQGEVSFDIPIEYYSIPGHLKMAGDPPKEINVRLKGSRRLLSSANPDHLRAEVDLSGAHPGANEILLSEANMNVPSGIAVTHYFPRRITIQLQRAPESDMEP